MPDTAAPALFDEGPFAPCPRPFNMAAHTFAPALADPDRIALEVLRGPGDVAARWTHGALREAVLRTAGGLAARGLGKGDRVLLRVGNEPAFPILFFAANALGAIPTPTSALLTPPEVDAILIDLAPRLVCVGEGVAAPDAPGAEVLGPEALADLARAEPVDFADTDPDDPAYVVYTSGSGGRPKGVLHAQRAAWARRMMWDGWYGLGHDDRMLHAGAFNWTYTLGAGLTDPWAAGAAALIYAGPRDRHVWPALVAAHGATLFAAAPGVYRQMLDAPDLAAGFAGLRHGLSAGEAMPAAVAAAWTGATGKPIYEALGMSEISTYVSFGPAAPPVPGHAGRPQRGRRVAVLDEADPAGGPAARGADGLLAVSRRDPGLMLGYWRRPAETEAAFRGEWFVTGDRTRMAADGTIAYLGRADDLLNAGGFRVSPMEIEAALVACEGVAEAAAFEMDVPSGARVIAALYVAAEGRDLDAALAAGCAARLAPYKRPRAFFRVAALPRGPNGKLLRRALRPPDAGG
jgi:acyl-coenzyme A synthetase/AMP-(fatty) acid ligase